MGNISCLASHKLDSYIINYFKLICFVINHPDLKKKCIYILSKKYYILKLTYFDHSNKNAKHLYLRIIRIRVQ